MSKSTPKAPDYAAAAEAQAQGSKEVTTDQTWANRPNQTTPWGQTSWESSSAIDPSTGQPVTKWDQTTTLTPDSQRALDAELGLQAGRSELGASLLPRAQDEFGQSMDWNKFDPMGEAVKAGNLTPEQLQRGYDTAGPELDSSQRYNQQANDAIYNQWADRALPQQERDTTRMQTQLANMGLQPGEAAYDTEMEKLRQSQGDAQRQAQYQATIGSGAEAQRMLGMDSATRAQLTGENRDQAGFGNTAAGQAFGMMSGAGQQNFSQQQAASNQQTQQRQQQIAEEMTKRGFSLNEINAIISGQQVAMPSMPGFNTAQRSEGVQSLNAAQMQGQADLDAYNAKQQATQGMMSGIGSMAGGFMMSDRRYKTSIRREGSTPGGTPLYRFRYVFGGPEFVGVMADEVPHAVTRIGGIDFVDYSKVN